MPMDEINITPENESLPETEAKETEGLEPETETPEVEPTEGATDSPETPEAELEAAEQAQDEGEPSTPEPVFNSALYDRNEALKRLTEEHEAFEEQRLRLQMVDKEKDAPLEEIYKGIEETWKNYSPYGDGRKIHELTPEEALNALTQLNTGGNANDALKFFQVYNQATLAKQTFKSQLTQVEAEIHSREWTALHDDLMAYCPTAKDKTDELVQFITEQIKTDALAAQWYNGNLIDKARLLSKAVRAVGLDKEVKKAHIDKIKAQAKEPLGGVQPGGGKNTGPRSFTRAEINKMSLEEYAKNEADIDEALKLGLIQ